MQLKDTITPAVLTAATGLLQPYCPDLSPRSLVAAIKAYGGNPADADHNRIEKPLTRKETAELLGCSLTTINNHLNAGRLRRIKLTEKSVRICPDSVRALLAGRAADMESEG